MNKFQKYFSDNLKMERKKKNLTQSQLANLCNTSTNYIGLMETYKKFPSINMLEKIINVLKIEPEILFKTPLFNYNYNTKRNRILQKIIKIFEEENIV